MLAAALLASCGSSSPGLQTSAMAAVPGPVDMHCIQNGMAVKQAIGMCMMGGGSAPPEADDAGGIDGQVAEPGDSSAGDDAAGGDDGGDNGGSDYGPTMYNNEGDDDDCKYHVIWTSTDVKKDVGVTFQVNVVRRMDGQPATGANIQVEALLGTTHPTPTRDIPNQESPGGNYKVGPFVLDQSGQWTVRFHFYEECNDSADSPHGHAAFFVNVP
ncbi:MAG TPA: hypothetical protein VMU50_05705 [Polyangia bacterium]|nr:hypothetical protein [Polyangia bacterium]